MGSKQIADAVHGPIQLTDVEIAIVNTRCFQRLRAVKQLGFAHYVFPGADYSRFSHSIGTCHVAGRFLDVIAQKFKVIEEEFVQDHRIAALLHDIGHYPFSHATEHAVDQHYRGHGVLEGDTQGASNSLDHERVGAKIIRLDPELNQVFIKFGIKADRLAQIFQRELTPNLTNLISSDLDADRLDYLSRTAHHTGLPYGTVDIDFLLTQLTLDKKQRVALSAKALRAADHFLVGRYCEYQQVAFHKVVTAFELVLQDVLKALLASGRLKLSANDVENLISKNEWHSLDDGYIVHLMRELRRSNDVAQDVVAKIDSLLCRTPPFLLWSEEKISTRKTNDRDDFDKRSKSVKNRIKSWCSKNSIPETHVFVWEKPGLTLTSVGGGVESQIVATGGAGVQSAKKGYAEAVRLQSDDTEDGSRGITEMRNSLLSVLGDYAWFAMRVYVLAPDADRQRVTELRADFKEAAG